MPARRYDQFLESLLRQKVCPRMRPCIAALHRKSGAKRMSLRGLVILSTVHSTMIMHCAGSYTKRENANNPTTTPRRTRLHVASPRVNLFQIHVHVHVAQSNAHVTVLHRPGLDAVHQHSPVALSELRRVHRQHPEVRSATTTTDKG